MAAPGIQQAGIRIAGDFKIKSVKLWPYNNARFLDLTNVRETINIYEDLFTNFIFGDIGVWDTWDLPMLYPLVGEERIEISFNRPGTVPQGGNNGTAIQTVPETQDFTMEFRVVKMTDRQRVKDQKQFYVLHFCSPEFITNKKNKVRKSYKNVLYSDIVSDIYDTYFKPVANKTLEIEPTMFKQNYTVPHQTPSQAINVICSRSIANGRTGSNYLFYENFDGFHCVTMEKLFEQAPVETILYQHHNLYLDKASRPIQEDVRNVNAYNWIEEHDIISNLTGGMYASKLLTYDIVRQRYFEYDYDYIDNFNKTKHLDTAKVCTPKLDALGQPYMARFDMVDTDKDHDKLDWIRKREPGILPTHVEDYLQHRHSQFLQINNFRLNLTLPGNSERRVGQVVDFAMPNAMSDPKRFAKDPEKYFSGKYLIMAIRHRIEINGYFNDVEIMKDTFHQDIEWEDPIPIYMPVN